MGIGVSKRTPGRLANRPIDWALRAAGPLPIAGVDKSIGRRGRASLARAFVRLGHAAAMGGALRASANPAIRGDEVIDPAVAA